VRCTAYVRFWHKADIPAVFRDVRFRGQRTSVELNEISVNDPKPRLQVEFAVTDGTVFQLEK
jgi:hypothetical protein